MARMQQRRDVAAEWTAANPTLAAGEIGVELDTGKYKLGDGVTPWATLAYQVDPARVEVVEDEIAGRLSEAGLSASYAAGNLPTVAVTGGATSRRFDPGTSTYGMRAASLRRFRAKMAKANAGTAVARIVCIGDSTTAGHPAAGVTRGVSDFPFLLTRQFDAAGLPITGTGLAPASQASTTNGDTRWSFTGTWADAALYRQSGASGSTATFTSDRAGTSVEIMVLNGGGNGAWSYSIDGGAAVPVSNVTGNGVNIITVTGLANTTHTVTITQTTATRVQVLGAQVLGTAGVTISNFGVGGSTSGTWAAAPFGQSTTYAGIKAAVSENPDLVLMNLGINDYFTSMALETHKANLTTIAGWFTPTADVVLAVGNPTSASYTPDWDTYRAAIYEVAEALDLPVLDLTDRWGSYAEANTAGLIHSDGTHPAPAGNEEIARAWIESLRIA